MALAPKASATAAIEAMSSEGGASATSNPARKAPTIADNVRGSGGLNSRSRVAPGKVGFCQARGVMIGQRVDGARAQRRGGVARASADAREDRVGARRARRSQQLAQRAGGVGTGVHGARLHQASKLAPNRGVRSGRPRREE